MSDFFDDLKSKKGHPAEARPGSALGEDTPDGPALNPYPIDFPKPADGSVEDSLHGCYENYKTYYQREVDGKKKKE